MNASVVHQIQQNIDEVRQQIANACQRVNRPSDSVTLIAVTKQRSIDEIRAAGTAGIADFGENRVEEGADKVTALQGSATSVRWHMIGHVQSRKARDVVAHFDVIHSLDSEKLLRRIDRFAVEMDRQIAAFIQVNVSGEMSKSGILVNNWEHDQNQRRTLWDVMHLATALTHTQIVGLMTMAPYAAQPQATRPVFVAMRRLLLALRNDFQDLALTELSMGMTNDYSVAIEEGATMVRIGRAIFGERHYG